MGAAREIKNFPGVDEVGVSHPWVGCLERSKADIVSGRDAAHGVTGLDDICHDVRGYRRWTGRRSVRHRYVYELVREDLIGIYYLRVCCLCRRDADIKPFRNSAQRVTRLHSVIHYFPHSFFCRAAMH